MIKQCTLCKGYGHYSPDCTKFPASDTSVKQCTLCKAYGHLDSECTKPRTMEQVCEQAISRQEAAENKAHIEAMRERDRRFHTEGLRRSIDSALSNVLGEELSQVVRRARARNEAVMPNLRKKQDARKKKQEEDKGLN